MFTKVSYMKLAEIDPANIDFHSMQNLDEAGHLFGQGDKSSANSQFTAGDKLFEQYLGIGGGDGELNPEEVVSNFSYR